MSDILTRVEPGLERLYGGDRGEAEKQRERCAGVARRFVDLFSAPPESMFSSPGRIELGGNHTDHNHGRVLAAAIHLDALCAASMNNDNMVRFYSQGYKKSSIIDLSDLSARASERNSTDGLIRGVAAEMSRLGYRTGGFNAYVSSRVAPGSGLSSSAAIEVLLATIWSHLYNGGEVPAEVAARVGQRAENYYFGKPCGLMDQMSIAVGGVAFIDFGNPDEPLVEKAEVDFRRWGLRLAVVDTGGCHSDLTADYAAAPVEMKAVAEALGRSWCRGLTEADLIRSMGALRCVAGDRAILRAFHFIREDERAGAQARALKRGDMDEFLRLVRESGNSSFRWLQNIYSPASSREQGVALGLAFAESYLEAAGGGACRVHGGGFAGTILAVVPEAHMEGFKARMEQVFEPCCASMLNIRSEGACRLG